MEPIANACRSCLPSGSEEEADNLAARVLAFGLLVVHDAVRGRQHEVAELARREDVARELLDASQTDVEARRDHAALVDATNQVHDDLARPVVIDNLQIAYVAMLLHHLEKLDDDLGARSDEHLPLPALLRVQNAVQAITEDADTHHDTFRAATCDGSANRQTEPNGLS